MNKQAVRWHHLATSRIVCNRTAQHTDNVLYVCSVLFEVFWDSVGGKVVVSQFFSAHEGYQTRVLAQERLEQLPAGLEDPWRIHEQDLA